MDEVTVIVCVAFDHRAPPDELTAFKNCIFACRSVDSATEVTGAYDLIVRGRCENLSDFHQRFEALRPQIARLVARLDTNFVSSERQCRARCANERFVWLPCEGGHKRVDSSLIDKVIAEGDYMRVHVDGWDCLIHQTLRSLRDGLDAGDFVQLNRSALVRIAFIDRFVHGERRWTAFLRDGSTLPVAKSHIGEVNRLIRTESPTPRPASSKSRATESETVPV